MPQLHQDEHLEQEFTVEVDEKAPPGDALPILVKLLSQMVRREKEQGKRPSKAA